MTIGDVFAVVASVIGIWISGWASLVLVALLFSRRAGVARDLIAQRPGRAFASGLFVVLTAGIIAINLVKLPSGLPKLAGWFVLLGLFAATGVGAGGLALLTGERIEKMAPGTSSWSALIRGAGIIVLAGLLPFLGWLVIVPGVLITSLGAGFAVVFCARRAQLLSATAVQPAAPGAASEIQPAVDGHR